MNLPRLDVCVAAIVFSVALAGCGSGDSAAPPPPPIEKTYNELAVPNSWVLFGQLDRNGGAQSRLYSANLVATGGTPLAGYSWSQTLGAPLPPPGVVVNWSDGTVGGSSPALASGFLYVDVTDGIVTRSSVIRIDLDPLSDSACDSSNAVDPCSNPPLTNLHADYEPHGKVGKPYTISLATWGGQPPYSWVFGSGTLPPGTTIDSAHGVLRGTPTTAGTYEFWVLTTDSAGGSTASEVAEQGIWPVFKITIDP